VVGIYAIWNWLTCALSADSAPAWVQAIGSIAAILVAVAVPAWQRRSALRDARNEKTMLDKEHLRRLITGVRAEINAAIEAVGGQQAAAKRTLDGLARAKQSGVTVVDFGPFPPGSVVLTDGVVYGEIASDLGWLPPEIIREIVAFYTRAREVGRLASMGTSAKLERSQRN
jgi:hypothetical protein